MPSINVTQKSAIVYFNTPDGVDLCGADGSVVALTANANIPELVGTPLSALPTDAQLLAVVLQGQPNGGVCVGALVGMYSGLLKAQLADSAGTVNVGTPLTINANGLWKVASSGEKVYARAIHAQWERGYCEIAFVPAYTIPSESSSES